MIHKPKWITKNMLKWRETGRLLKNYGLIPEIYRRNWATFGSETSEFLMLSFGILPIYKSSDFIRHKSLHIKSSERYRKIPMTQNGLIKGVKIVCSWVSKIKDYVSSGSHFRILFHHLILSQDSFQVLLIAQPAITCSKLTIETLEQGVKYVQSQWRRSGVFIVNLEHISHLDLVFLLLILSR